MTDVAPPELSRLDARGPPWPRRAARSIATRRRFAVTIGVIVAVLVVSTLTIDLGPALKARAEKAGGDWLERKMTIGRLGVHLGTRQVRHRGPAHRRHVSERAALARRQAHRRVADVERAVRHARVLLDSIEMTDWRMVVESFPDGRQTFPRLTGPPRPPRTGPRLVVTTMQYVRAHRGELVFNDYGSDWRAVAPNLEVTVDQGRRLSRPDALLQRHHRRSRSTSR